MLLRRSSGLSVRFIAEDGRWLRLEEHTSKVKNLVDELLLRKAFRREYDGIAYGGG
jgi:hypothetical protein